MPSLLTVPQANTVLLRVAMVSCPCITAKPVERSATNDRQHQNMTMQWQSCSGSRAVAAVQLERIAHFATHTRTPAHAHHTLSNLCSPTTFNARTHLPPGPLVHVRTSGTPICPRNVSAAKWKKLYSTPTSLLEAMCASQPPPFCHSKNSWPTRCRRKIR